MLIPCPHCGTRPVEEFTFLGDARFIKATGNRPIAIEWNYEAGLSFSTDPVLRLWKVKLPWIALGYRWGDRQSGLRLNFTFPF